MTAAFPKPVLRTAVVEVAVPVPRARLWSALVSRLDAGAVGPPAEGWGEALLSFEEPWRRVGRITLDARGLVPSTSPPSPLVEHTAAIRDDGDSCLLIWAAVVEVAPEANAAVLASTDDLVAALDAAMRRWAADVATAATASAAG